jgi:hypothetical protein
LYSVAHHLRLDYAGLKKRLGGVSHRRRKARKPLSDADDATGLTILAIMTKIAFKQGHSDITSISKGRVLNKPFPTSLPQ